VHSEPCACVVLRCRDVAADEAFFRELGFRLATVLPADAPRELELLGHGLRICLQLGSRDGGGQLRVPGAAVGTRQWC
jgi:catechol 2,3-dioxygenase-like lactoylglutathione lyase family enzyme